ncbi:transposase [Heyndrickxia coagulans]|uniref:integrase core domain-containing protein n=1 Tax=Heyndrickxia coagulans TaxID=1398 RepID=UPI0012BAC8B1|nr:transposase [Heyndrickxia coagulans]
MYLTKFDSFSKPYLKEYNSPREARKEIGNLIQFYNHERLHQALGYKTPASVYGL